MAKYLKLEYEAPGVGSGNSKLYVYSDIEKKNGYYKPKGNPIMVFEHMVIPSFSVESGGTLSLGKLIKKAQFNSAHFSMKITIPGSVFMGTISESEFYKIYKQNSSMITATVVQVLKEKYFTNDFGFPQMASWLSWSNGVGSNLKINQIHTPNIHFNGTLTGDWHQAWSKYGGFISVYNVNTPFSSYKGNNYTKNIVSYSAGNDYNNYNIAIPTYLDQYFGDDRVGKTPSIYTDAYGEGRSYETYNPTSSLYNLLKNYSTISVELQPDYSEVYAKKGEYDLGSEALSCFYCNDATQSQHLSYLTKTPYITIKSHSTWSHSCEEHGETPSTETTDETTGSVTEHYNSDLVYKGVTRNVGQNLPDKSYDYGTVSKLSQGTVGEYVDGVARTPFLMLELRASDDATVGYNISLPANSIVSFNHERNMSDSYNTFTLEVFDKDAMQVEDKLLLGFRSVVFYYTDFVSTSKRYKGLILDYKTVITNKGLMLTISGYSTNASFYVGQDSIPWSKLCEVNGISFYYWKNKAGEYIGELKRTVDAGGTVRWNSTDGDLVPESAIGDPDALEYSLKYPDEEDSSKYHWTTYDEVYRGKVPGESLDLYKPTVHTFTLNKEPYNPKLATILSTYNGVNLIDKRPSDIVKIICIMNNWSYEIVETKKVSEIPDQISMSYIQYIKEKLIPISISEGTIASTQYYFWFDDAGVAHYEPRKMDSSSVKKLYFNSVEHKDSYPLIGFTSSSNGSVLMATDATNVMETINAFTGDALSLDVIADASTDPALSGALSTTTDWYQTNRLMQEEDPELQKLKLIRYNKSNSLPSETELKNELINTWGRVARYSWKAILNVYGVTDLTPGDYIDVYIYLDEGARSNAEVSQKISTTTTEKVLSDVYTTMDGPEITTHKEYKDVEKETVTGYIGNLTLHHSSGRYIINTIKDSISAGKYTSELEVLKIDKNQVLNVVTYDTTTNKENTEKTVVGSAATGAASGAIDIVNSILKN